jgi:hypothetical protein
MNYDESSEILKHTKTDFEYMDAKQVIDNLIAAVGKDVLLTYIHYDGVQTSISGWILAQ